MGKCLVIFVATTVISCGYMLDPTYTLAQIPKEVADLQTLSEEFLLRGLSSAVTCDNYTSQVRIFSGKTDWLKTPNAYYLYFVLSKTKLFYVLEFRGTNYIGSLGKLYFTRDVGDLERPRRVAEETWKDALIRLAPNGYRHLIHYERAEYSDTDNDCHGE